MPNLYATPTEVKAGMPDAIQAGTTKYDAELLRLANDASRLVDKHCRRTFFPQSATRYFAGDGSAELWVGDLLTVTSVGISSDRGQTYTNLAVTDYIPTRAGDENTLGSYDMLTLASAGTRSTWPTGQRSVRVIGVWAYADDRAAAWEASQDTVQDNPLLIGASTVNVASASGANLWGISPRIQAGQLWRIESEFLEATVVATNAITVARARNGSSAAQHAQNTAIELWRPPDPVKQAVIITVAKSFERGQQGFGDARAVPEMGQLFFVKELDAEARSRLELYRKMAVG